MVAVRYAYRIDDKASWLIEEWYREVIARRAALLQAGRDGLSEDEIKQMENVSFLDIATRVNHRMCRRESVNKNKAVGCILHMLTEDIVLKVHYRKK